MKLEYLFTKQIIDNNENGSLILPFNRDLQKLIDSYIQKGYITKIIKNSNVFKNTKINTFTIFFNKKHNKQFTNLSIMNKDKVIQSNSFDFSEFDKEEMIERKNEERRKLFNEILLNFNQKEIEELQLERKGIIERMNRGNTTLLDSKLIQKKLLLSLLHKI